MEQKSPANSQQPSVVVGDPSGKTPGSRSAFRELLSTIGVLATALLIALALIGFVFQSYEVSGESMEVTLDNQDRLIIWKLPRTWSRVTGHNYVPNRGDIIVFDEEGLADTINPDVKQLIKRVIGLPGDHVVVKDGIITVYNSEHPTGFQPDKALPYGSETTIPYTSGNIDITLNDDEIFVCGDNRGNSYDSRSFGPIPVNSVVGKLVARIYPVGNIEKF
ncbi:signal peptidase I [Candidatus Saccharibacteria bacterium]|nr:signal peptidase I [Candidatus Saccharibacteria bacterium]